MSDAEFSDSTKRSEHKKRPDRVLYKPGSLHGKNVMNVNGTPPPAQNKNEITYSREGLNDYTSSNQDLSQANRRPPKQQFDPQQQRQQHHQSNNNTPPFQQRDKENTGRNKQRNFPDSRPPVKSPGRRNDGPQPRGDWSHDTPPRFAQQKNNNRRPQPRKPQQWETAQISRDWDRRMAPPGPVPLFDLPPRSSDDRPPSRAGSEAPSRSGKKKSKKKKPPRRDNVDQSAPIIQDNSLPPRASSEAPSYPSGSVTLDRPGNRRGGGGNRKNDRNRRRPNVLSNDIGRDAGDRQEESWTGGQFDGRAANAVGEKNWRDYVSQPQPAVPVSENHSEQEQPSVDSIISGEVVDNLEGADWSKIVEEETRNDPGMQVRASSVPLSPSTSKGTPGLLPISIPKPSAPRARGYRSQRGFGGNSRPPTSRANQIQEDYSDYGNVEYTHIRSNTRRPVARARGRGRGFGNNTYQQHQASFDLNESYASMQPPSENGGSLDRFIEENFRQKINMHESELQAAVGYMAEQNASPHSFNIFLQRVRECSEAHREMLLLDVEVTYRKNLEQLLWKNCFYQPIEALRTWIASAGDAQEKRPWLLALLELISQAVNFYKALLAEYETRYQMKISTYVLCNPDVYSPMDEPNTAVEAPKSRPNRRQKVALMSAQKYMVALGDLHRYICMYEGYGPAQYNKARRWYSKAVLLHPGLGRTYNQLAILGMYTQRHLDTVYYYLRALAAKYEFTTAMQSVRAAFSDIDNKVQIYEGKLQDELEGHNSERLNDGQNRRRKPQAMGGPDCSFDDWKSPSRREVWIGGTTSQGEDERTAGAKNSTQTDILLQASTGDLHKRTVTYMLNCVGMLLTKINMDRFDLVAERALTQLRELMRREETPLSASQLLHLSLLCLSTVHRASTKAEKGTSNAIHHKAVQLVLSVWALMLEQVHQFCSHIESLLTGGEAPPQLLRTLPALRVVCCWLSLPNVYSLYKNLSLDGLDLEGFGVKIWPTFAELCNKLTVLNKAGKLRESRKVEDCVTLHTPEDVVSCSFYDAFDSKPLELFYPDLSHKWVVHARLESILNLADYLDGMEMSYFGYVDGVFVAKKASRPASPLVPMRRTQASDDEQEEKEEQDEDLSHLSAEMRQLHVQKREQKRKEQLLSNEANGSGIVLKVCPTVLIPDTNVFIEHLNFVKIILASEKYTMTIPILVLQELRGLKTAVDDEWLSSRAIAAAKYLEQMSSSKILGSITSKGKRLDSLMFASEETEAERSVINDDRILNCCKFFVDDRVGNQIVELKSEPLTLLRKVVLLTDDRALRIKASSENIPVRSIQNFVEWAGLA